IAPGLHEGDYGGERIRTLEDGIDLVADIHVVEVSRFRTPALLGPVLVTEDVEFLLGILPNRLFNFLVFLAFGLGRFTLGPETPGIGSGKQGIVLVEEGDGIDLLDRTTGKPGFVFDQVFQRRLGADSSAVPYRL